MKPQYFLIYSVILSVLMSSCADSRDSGNGNSSAQSCTTAQDFAIKGFENDYSVTLDASGSYESQINFKTAAGHDGFYRLEWRAGPNRQTCSSGTVSESGFDSYVQISSSPTLLAMRVVPGLNYFDYTAYGCRTAQEEKCSEIVEQGTAVVKVDYVK